jgi:hypothetical protein
MQTRCNTCLRAFQDSDIVCGYEHYSDDRTFRPDGLQKPDSIHLIHENCLGRHSPKTQPCPGCNKNYDFYCGTGRYSEMNRQLHETFPELFDDDDVEIVKKTSPKKSVFVIDLDSDSDSDGKAKGWSFRKSKTRGVSLKKGKRRGKRSKRVKSNNLKGKRKSRSNKIKSW